MPSREIENLTHSKFSISVLTTPFLSCALGFAGTVALIIHAQEKIGASPAQITSAITSLCVAISVTGFILTLYYRVPVILGWSTPGAALLIAYSSGSSSYQEIVGAFIVAGIMHIAVGYSPPLRRVVSKIPEYISSAMLAGIVFPYCLPLFRDFSERPFLAAPTLITFIIFRNLKANYAISAAVLVAIISSGSLKHYPTSNLGGVWESLHLTSPILTLRKSIELSIPLFLVTLASQNLPGILVLKSAGYEIKERAIATSLGLASALIAPFGGHGIGLASLTAAMCVGEESGLSKKNRWISGILYAIFYAITATFCSPIIYFFSSMPRELIEAVTAVAVIPILVGSVGNMMVNVDGREAAILTFAATASGMSFAGIGAAFWGLLVGCGVLIAKRWFNSAHKL